MGRINVTFPIFADSNVQPPDVAASAYGKAEPLEHMQMCMPHDTPVALPDTTKSSGGKDKLGCDATHFLDNGVAAHDNSEPSH